MNTKNSKIIVIIVFLLNIVIFSFFLPNFYQEKEEIRILATENFNEKAKGNEIWIKKILIEKKEKDLPNPIKGEWLWKYSDKEENIVYRYGWNSYGGYERNISNEIVLNIPIGKNRSIVFEKGIYRGIVIVEHQGNKYTLDCYENTQDIHSEGYIVLEDSSSTKVLINNFINFAIIIIISFISTFLEINVLNKIFNINSKYYYKNIKVECFVFFMIIVMFTIMVKTSNVSMWNDEVAILDFVYNKSNLFDALQANIKFLDNTPPLFNIMAYYWVKLMPYGEFYLYLLPEITIVFGILILFMAAKLAFSKKIALYTVFISSTSILLMLNAGHEFRAYSLLFFSSSFYLYSFFYRQKNGINIKSLVLFSISMTILIYTHYYGVILCFCAFFYDTYICLLKKHLSYIISYIMTGFFYLPWVIILFSNNRNFSTWVPKPTFADLLSVPYFLLGNNKILIFLFLFYIFYLLKNIFFKDDSHYLNEKIMCNVFFIAYCIFSVILFSYFVAMINEKVGSFYYRYFIVIVPMVFISISFVISYIEETLLLDRSRKNIFFLSMCCFFIIMNMENYSKLSVNPKAYYQPFRESVNFLKQQYDIYYKDTIVMTAPPYKGGIEYLFTEKGRLQKSNIINFEEIIYKGEDLNMNDLLMYKKLYIINHHTPISAYMENQIEKKYNLVNDMVEHGLKIYEVK